MTSYLLYVAASAIIAVSSLFMAFRDWMAEKGEQWTSSR